MTHEPNIAHFTKRMILFKDGRIRKDDPVTDRPRALDVLQLMPTLED